MNKEDLERARREADRKETDKIMKAINEQNKRKQQERLLQEQINKIKKEKEAKKEKTINFIFVVVVILTLFFMLAALVTVSAQTNELSAETCERAGFPAEYCGRYANQ